MRRDNEAFLSEQYKEIEENNRTGKTRHLLKKIRDTKGIFNAKMGTITDRNGMEKDQCHHGAISDCPPEQQARGGLAWRLKGAADCVLSVKNCLMVVSEQ